MGPSEVGMFLKPGLGSIRGVNRSRGLDGCKNLLPTVPDKLTLPEPGLRPYTPQKCDGILMLPPISDPHPMAEPFIARSAPSPPLDPPGVYLTL